MERYSGRPKGTWIATMGVKELQYCRLEEGYFQMGAGLTLSELGQGIRTLSATIPGTVLN